MPHRSFRPISIFFIFLLSACSATSDFGRSGVDQSISAYSARVSGEDSKSISLTPQEREMVNQMHHFAYLDSTAQSHVEWAQAFIDILGQGRVYPITEQTYFNWLMRDNRNSPDAAYGRLAADIGADLLLMPKLFNSICQVQKIDENRLAAAQQIPTTPSATHQGLAQRREYNETNISITAEQLHFRYNSYSFALEQLLVQAPNIKARSVDAQLSDYALKLNSVKNDRYCPAKPMDTKPTSRFASASETVDLG